MRMQAVLNGTVVADSDATVVVEGNHYFPVESVRMEYFEPTSTHTTCHWKGVASYYSVSADGTTSTDAAWYYPEPSEAAAEIKDHVAFWKDVEVRTASGEALVLPEEEIVEGRVC